MYSVYKDWCNYNSTDAVCSQIFSIVLQQRNISIYCPHKDQCDVCTGQQAGSIDDESYQEHIIKKKKLTKLKGNGKGCPKHFACTKFTSICSILQAQALNT